MKRTPIIPIRWVDEQHDTDRDAVPNFRDCNPWNPHEHMYLTEDGTTWISRKEYLNKHSFRLFGIPYSEVTHQQKRELKKVMHQSDREGGELYVEKWRSEYDRKQQEKLKIKQERKKMIESGLGYKIVVGDKGGDNYFVMAGKPNTLLKKVFEGTLKQCKIWGKKRGIRFKVK